MTFRMHWIPWVFVAAFGVVVAVNATMVYFALSTWTGVAVEAPYRRGIEYNRVIAAQAKQDALGWNFDLSWRASGSDAGSGELRLRVTEATGVSVGGIEIEGTAERPVGKMEPIPLALRGISEGQFAASVDLGARGNWDIRLSARRGEDRAVVTKRIFVP